MQKRPDIHGGPVVLAPDVPGLRLNKPSEILGELEVINDHYRWLVKRGQGTWDDQMQKHQFVNEKLMLAAVDGLARNIERQINLAEKLRWWKEVMVPRESFELLYNVVLSALKQYPAAMKAVEEALAEVKL